MYNHALPTSGGLDISFNQAQYGGGATGADGISLFLVDGATDLTTPGTPGGSLGYSTDLSTPGVDNGLLGIGLDGYGNFSRFFEDGTGCTPAPDPWGTVLTRNNVTARGPGHGFAVYCYLTSALEQGHSVTLSSGANTTRAAATLAVHVVIDPSTATSPMVTVSINGAEVLQTAEPSELTSASTFKFGFSSSTGGFNDVHEILGLTVDSVTALAPQLALNVATQSGASPIAGSSTTLVYEFHRFGGWK